MLDKRERNIEIFEDTERLYESDRALKESIGKSVHEQRFFAENEKIDIGDKILRTEKTEIKVSEKRTLEAASLYAGKGRKTCILNFASATNPGGGVTRGSSAQEECICRCSTLYACLNTKEMWDKFYGPHRKANNRLYNDDIIYTPGVKVFKGDTAFPQEMQRSNWYDVNVITCAAPNLRDDSDNYMNPGAGVKVAKVTDKKLEELLTNRVRRIFEVAVWGENKVLILGAFGCGAFRNPPEIVAKVFKRVMEEYRGYFEIIEYAVYHGERDVNNYISFKRELKE